MQLSLSQLKPPTKEALTNYNALNVERELEGICRSLGIWQPHFAEYNTMSSYLFPSANHERLFAIGLYNNLLYYVDDTFDRHAHSGQLDTLQMKEIFFEAMQVFLTGQATSSKNPVVHTAATLHRYLVPHAPHHQWVQRFAEDTIAHLQSSLRDVDTELPAGQTSWYDHYNEIRDLDSGMAPTIDLIEYALGHIMPSEIREHPIFKQAQHYVARYCSLTNDIFSYEKEVIAFGSEFNAVVMLQRDGYSLVEAVDHLIEDLNNMVTAFIALTRDLPTWDDDETQALAERYMESLWHQIVAAYHWQFSTNRYRSQNSIFAELRTPLQNVS